MATARPRRPWSVHVLAASVLLEALAVLALAVWGAAELVQGRSRQPALGVALVVAALALAAALAASARGAARGARAGRAFVVTWQLLQGATALTLAQATGSGLAWLVVVVSAVVALLVVVGARPRASDL